MDSRMRTMLTALAAALALLLPAAAQQPAAEPPHAFLFGTWIGGIYPPPRDLPPVRCLAEPSVIFTRDLAMRTVLLEPTLRQRVVTSARATPAGWEFRFRPLAQPRGLVGGTAAGSPPEAGFGCPGGPDVLVVQKRGPNEIIFPGCTDFPAPLVRCGAQ